MGLKQASCTNVASSSTSENLWLCVDTQPTSGHKSIISTFIVNLLTIFIRKIMDPGISSLSLYSSSTNQNMIIIIQLVGLLHSSPSSSLYPSSGVHSHLKRQFEVLLMTLCEIGLSEIRHDSATTNQMTLSS